MTVDFTHTDNSVGAMHELDRSIERLVHRKILFIGINYWPEPTGNAPYTTGLAEHLAMHGVIIDVITGMPYYPSWKVEGRYSGRIRLTESRSGVTLHRFRNYIPSKQTAVRRIGFETSFLANALLYRSIPRPDLVLGVLPSLSDGVLSVAASARYSAPFGLLVQDLVGQSAAQSGISGGRRVVGATSAIEGWVARKARGIAIVAEGFRPRLESMGVVPDRITRVRNWTHVRAATDDALSVRKRLGLPRDKFVCLHAGNMGLKQGLENVLDCARLAETALPDVLFALMGDGNQRKALENLAVDLRNVRFLPTQSEEEFPNVLAAADVLLVNQRPSVTDMSLPGKLTSYFASGRPVIAAVSPHSETAKELTGVRVGYVVPAGEPTVLLQAICDLRGDDEMRAQLGQRAMEFQETHLTKEMALTNLTKFVAELMPERTSND